LLPPAGASKFHSMATAPLDFSQLTPEQRLQLIEALWDSLTPEQVPVSPEVTAELHRRLRLHEQNPERGQAWREALDDIERGHR
jgi:putative addiction module component (TIGR02574 family)